MMKCLLLHILLLLAYDAYTQCQSESIFLESQTQVDSFIINYPLCDSLTNIVIIGEDINDLRPLSSIRYVSENIELIRTSVPNLDGLDNLTFVGGTFLLRTLDSLENVQALKALESVGSITFISSPKISSLEGLESLRIVSFGLNLISAPNINNLNGLSGLDSVRFLTMNGNIELAGLRPDCHVENITIGLNGVIRNSRQIADHINEEGLSKLDLFQTASFSFDPDIKFSNLSTLSFTQVQELDFSNTNLVLDSIQLLKLTSCPQILGTDGVDGLYIEALGFRNLPNLRSINAFTGLSTSSQILLIDCPQLNDISLLSDMDSIVRLQLKDNPILDECSHTAICNLLSTNPDFVIVSNNGVGCSSDEEIEQGCLSSIIGYTYNNKYYIYPNPTEGHIFIESGYPYSRYEIYNYTGKLISGNDLSYGRIDLSEITTGMYILKLYNGQDLVIVSRVFKL